MSGHGAGLGEVDLSDLIGEIYDCVIEPAQWQPLLERMRRLLDCANCTIEVVELPAFTSRWYGSTGIAPEWLAKIPDYAAELAELYARATAATGDNVGEPIVFSRADAPDLAQSNRYIREWAAPQGLIDAATLPLIRSKDRFASISMGRHQTHGPIGDREVRLLRLLAPHLARAVTISDLIDRTRIEADTLGRTLDMLPAGVVLVAENAEILHLNRSAKRMIEQATPIAAVAGRLAAVDARAAGKLRQVVKQAARGEAALDGGGIGMALNRPGAPAATAHVLPIGAGKLRTRLAPRGAAAVFIAMEGQPPSMDLQPVADAFGLSPAETRVLARLIEGASLAEAAASLGIAQTTAKTHLARLFAKTGTQRQASLIAVVSKLLTPAQLADGA